MQYQFSSAAQRALIHAAGRTNHADYADLAAPALLLELLAESECRAALLLAEHGITPESVYQQWPKLQIPPLEGGIENSLGVISPKFDRSLQIVSQSIAEYAYPPTLETEHLLLALLAAKDELAHWLNQQGVQSTEIEADIRKRHGYQQGPLPIDSEQPDSKEPDSKGHFSDPVQPHLSSLIPHPSSAPNPQSLISNPLRIIDAAANRAREGLRVAEDFVRFVLDDRHLTNQCKQLRHDLAALLARLPGQQLLAARETQADVGTALSAPSEHRRSDAADVLTANFARLQESLRSLEEFGKLLDPAWAAEIKQLRYRSYTLHRAVEITRTSIQRLAHARLYVLIDGRDTLEEFRQLAQALIAAGVHILQLRDKALDDRQLLQRGRLLRELTLGDCPNLPGDCPNFPKENGTVPFTPSSAQGLSQFSEGKWDCPLHGSSRKTLFIMNDRPDLAALCHADGVHLGQEDVTVKDARAILGADALIGVSTHAIQQARQAVLDGANYIGAGPTFASSTKNFEKFPGLDFLKEIAAEIRLPAFAIGGITPANLPQVLSTAITRVAVSGAITAVPNPAAVVQELSKILENPEHKTV